jgi:hypothetical protein
MTATSRNYNRAHNPDPEWDEDVWIGNDDGSGYWMKDGMICKDEVFPSEQEDATHVIWYSK